MSALTPEQWKEVGPYLDEVLDTAPEHRAGWLLSLSNKDAGLASLLKALLEEQDQLKQEGFLEGSPSRPSAGLAGQTVGAYTLVSQIGQGGMGSVWLAQRSDGRFERQAAVKFISAALTGPATEERFKREGNILARLTHPHIAELLDAGISLDGSPYLILEYVPGVSIDLYCDERQLDVDARIRLFLDVLDGVALAHANLVVHRDLKPSNVLVTNDGTVKLLDFGIAKLLGDETNSAATALTLQAGAAMTPLFAAPEQVTGGTITTATDVYALGVLLYILLTGQHPGGRMPQSAAGLVKAIVETEPSRASAAIILAPGRDEAKKRGVTSEKLRRQLRGDLDTIIGKALKKNPQERYASATAFADDLGRYLKHEPIAARPDSVTYRAGKFLRRQRLPVGAALLLIASLAGGLYDVNRERVISQRRFSDVREIANKLFDVDAQVRDLPGSTKARQMIVDTSLEYLTRLTADVQGDPTLSLEVGNAYMRVARVQGIPIGPTLGQKDEAEKNLEIADGFIQFVLRKEPGNRVAMLRAAQIAHDQMILARFAHRGDRAHALAVESADWLEKFRAGKGDDAEATGILNTYLNVADQFGTDGDDDRALQLSRRGGEIAKELNRPASAGTFLWVAADVLKSRGDLDEALATIRDSVKLLDPGPDWAAKISQTLNFHHALIYEGRILGEVDDVSLGRAHDALPPLQQAFDGSDAIVHRDPKDHSSRGYLAMSAITMGGILRGSDPRRALAVYDHARQHLVEVPGDAHLERLEIRLLAGSSYALRKLGRNAEARERLESAINKIKERKFYPTDKIDLGSETGDALEALADLEAENGSLPGAIRIYEELLAKMDPRESDAQFGLPDTVHVSIVCSSAAAAYRRADHLDRASAIEHRRLEMWQRWAQKLPNNAFVLRQVELTRAKPAIE